MKIADGLLLLKDIAEEMSRLRQLAKVDAWEYRRADPDAKWIPTFDIEENHKRVKSLSRLHRKLSRAISKANASVELDLSEEEYKDWL